MKPLLLSLFFLLSLLSKAQTEIILSVKQLPELGFSLSRNDTTIAKSSSVVLGTDLVLSGGSGEYSFQWSPEETLSNPVILNPVATPLDTTTYVLTVTDQLGCSFSLSYTVNVRGPVVGINSHPHAGMLEALLFPNPNEGRFKVRITGNPSERVDLKIFEATGRAVYQKSVMNFVGSHSEELHVKLVRGVYTIRISSGHETISRQMIIQ